MPLFHLVRTAKGNRWLLRAGLPDALSERLEALLGAEPVAADFFQVEPRTEKLAPLTAENADLLRPDFADLVPELAYGQPFMARVEGGAAVSVCRSPSARAGS